METEMAIRPYAPASNVIMVLNKFRSRNLPLKIDGEYLRDIGIQESLVSRVLFALKFLNVVNEADEPSIQSKAIHTSTDEEYKTILAGLVRAAYIDVFDVVDPTQDPQDKIANVFRKYTPASQRDRMVTFFLGMCREAGISPLEVLKTRAMTTASGMTKPMRKLGPAQTHQQKKDQEKMVPAQQYDIAPALEGLIRSLPKPGEVLSKDRREKWLAMARVTLEFVYPEPIEEQDKNEVSSKDDNVRQNE